MKKNVSHSGRKGFTLVELTIALSVTAVLLTIISALILSVVKQKEHSFADYSASTEVTLAYTAVSEWYDFVINNNHEIQVQYQENSILIYDKQDGLCYLSFDKLAKKLTFDKNNGGTVFTATFEEVTDINFVFFDDENKVLKTTVFFSENSEKISFILAGRRV